MIAIPRPRLPVLVLQGGMALFILLLAVSLGLARDGREAVGKASASSRLFASTEPERARLRSYQTIQERLYSADAASFSDAALEKAVLPPGVARPDARSLRKQEVVDGFQGLLCEWEWKSLEKADAMKVLSSLQSARDGIWQLTRMKLVALPDGATVSLRLTLETAAPVTR